MIQATVAIISSCLALSSAHLPMMMITVISTLTIISTALLIQFELVTPAKAKYKFAKGDAVAILKKMFSFAKDDEDIQFLNDVKKNMDTAQQKADEFAGYDNTGQLLYRFMTDLSEYIITFTVVTAFIPSFPVTSITGGPFSAGMTAFSGLSLLAMSKSLSSMVKDASAFIRSSGEISEVASGYDAIRNLLEQISTYTQTKLEESCKLFLDPKKKELNYITKNAVECLILGVFISTGFNLYYDAMIISVLSIQALC